MDATTVVTIDQSHIMTIGEKLYGESLELIRELVSNAYEVDATRVWIDMEPKRMIVRDDGTGMDRNGLREYFNIGSQNKLPADGCEEIKKMKIVEAETNI